MERTVLLATMSLEAHGGVADQMTSLALELRQYGIRPILLVRNPLAAGHPYASHLRRNKVALWAVSHQLFQAARQGFTVLLWLALPLALLDALLRHKTVQASKQSVWGVLRRLGYWGLDVLFWLGLVRGRFLKGAQVAHFRKPDGWKKIGWAKQLGLTTVYTEDTLPRPETRHYYDGISRVQETIHAITAVSNASAEALQGFLEAGTAIDVIPNMVCASKSAFQIHRPALAGFTVGSLCRLAPEKNLDTLLRAAHRAVGYNPAIRVVIYGNGPELAQLMATVQSLELGAHVTFAGAFKQADLPQVMDQIDVIVSSSVYEGFGVALVEGMAHGKPAVATAVGGVPEVVVDGVTGLLVPPGSPRRMGDAILELASDSELYRRMATAARERYLRCYTPDIVVPQYLTVYERIAPGAQEDHDSSR